MCRGEAGRRLRSRSHQELRGLVRRGREAKARRNAGWIFCTRTKEGPRTAPRLLAFTEVGD